MSDKLYPMAMVDMSDPMRPKSYLRHIMQTGCVVGQCNVVLTLHQPDAQHAIEVGKMINQAMLEYFQNHPETMAAPTKDAPPHEAGNAS